MYLKEPPKLKNERNVNQKTKKLNKNNMKQIIQIFIFAGINLMLLSHDIQAIEIKVTPAKCNQNDGEAEVIFKNNLNENR